MSLRFDYMASLISITNRIVAFCKKFLKLSTNNVNLMII